MDRLTYYVLRQLLVGTFIVTVGLTGVIWLSQSLRMIDMIVNRGLSVVSFFQLTILLLPNFMTLILPVALFAVVLFIYSKLSTDRELVIMRSAGISQLGLAKPTAIIACCLVGIEFLLNLHLVPVSYQSFRELQWNIRYSYAHMLLLEGTFNMIADGVTVYVKERTSDGELLGLMIHDDRDSERSATILAARGGLVESKTGARVVLFDGNRQEVKRGTNDFSILYFDRYAFELGGDKKEGVIRYREARERRVSELLNIERDSLLNPKDYGKFRVEAHRRLTTPLEPLTYALIGLAWMISGGAARRGQTLRLGSAVLMIILLQASSMGLQNLCARYLDLIPLMYLHAVLPMILALLVMGQPPRRLRLPALLRRAGTSG